MLYSFSLREQLFLHLYYMFLDKTRFFNKFASFSVKRNQNHMVRFYTLCTISFPNKVKYYKIRLLQMEKYRLFRGKRVCKLLKMSTPEHEIISFWGWAKMKPAHFIATEKSPQGWPESVTSLSCRDFS